MATDSRKSSRLDAAQRGAGRSSLNKIRQVPVPELFRRYLGRCGVHGHQGALERRDPSASLEFGLRMAAMIEPRRTRGEHSMLATSDND